ncbi:hypothetical protein LSTR_LSTR005642 [Laodelphax striatellus]|uniref:Uncharacterized protein n=1 Tax=Laodelphax striatellus TaxID=195883 RepID=A0A482WW70_LAOST|nr:hypothetical protein LSTR_LSTR005642 [Laodelphax striatellus]
MKSCSANKRVVKDNERNNVQKGQGRRLGGWTFYVNGGCSAPYRVRFFSRVIRSMLSVEIAALSVVAFLLLLLLLLLLLIFLLWTLLASVVNGVCSEKAVFGYPAHLFRLVSLSQPFSLNLTFSTPFGKHLSREVLGHSYVHI